ncbi:MAG: hypothetical protein GX572_06025 [Clostridia bacterium]|nr:hypothetical protein [Clostridia bacterium]
MDCHELELLMQMSLDKTLSDAGRELLHAHLVKCRECAAAFAEYEQLDALLKEEITAVEAPADLKGNIMAALPSPDVWVKPAPVVWAKPAPRRSKFRRLIPMISVAATAAALLLVAGLSGWFSGDPPQVDHDLRIALSDPDLPHRDDDIFGPGGKQNQPVNNGETDPDNADIEVDNDPGQNEGPSATYNGGIPLPKVAHSTESHGSYSLYTLASADDYGAVLPRISGNVVTYYLIADGAYLEWEADLTRKGEPVYVGETESLPSAAAIAGFSDQSAEYGFTYISAISPDNTKLAINRQGGDKGFWLTDRTRANSEPVLIAENGGGLLISWAPDGAKVLYTAADGSLHLYYPDQGVILDLFAGETGSVCWAADSRNIVFAAYDGKTGEQSIFSVIVP